MNVPDTCRPDEYSQVAVLLAVDRLLNSLEAADAEGHLAGELLQHIGELLEIAGHKKLRLLRRDIERHVLRVDRVGDFLHVRLEAAHRFADRGEQTGAVNFRFIERADQAVFHRPPMEPGEQRHLRRLAEILLPLLHELRRFVERFRHPGSAALSRSRDAGSLRKARSLSWKTSLSPRLRRNAAGNPRIRWSTMIGACPAASWTMSGAGVYSMWLIWRMSHAITSTRYAWNSMNAAGGMNPSTATPPQPILPEDFVHLLDPRNPVEGDAGIEQPLEVEFVRVFAQEKNVLPHDEAPDRVIDRRVFVIALVDGELEQMLRKCGHRLVVHRNGV